VLYSFQVFRLKVFYAFLTALLCTACPSHHILFDCITVGGVDSTNYEVSVRVILSINLLLPLSENQSLCSALRYQIIPLFVSFQVLKAAEMKMTVFLGTASCSRRLSTFRR
jgi:hypothetical protein